MSEPQQEQIGEFRIIREIGRGGMGVVYEAEQVTMGRQVALKVLARGAGLDPKALERFKREIRATAKVSHPNIVRIFSVGEWEGRPYYTMEYIEGISMDRLVDLIRRGTSLDFRDSGAGQGLVDALHRQDTVLLARLAAAEDEETDRTSTESPEGEQPAMARPRGASHFRFIARLVRDAAGALDYAHRQGVVHRDIKPSNLLLTQDEQVRVTDFGLAVEIDGASLTQTGTMAGTPQYMSPEQLLIRRVRVDARTDVYSLGVTLYELLTLTPPFSADSREQLLLNIAVKEPRRPQRLNPHVPRDLQTIALKAMEKDPQHRYQSAQLMADDLSRFLNDEPIRAVAPSMATKLSKFVRRHKALSAAVVASFAFLIIGSVAAWEVQEQRRQAEAKTLIQRAEKAGEEGRANVALDLLKDALALDRQNALVAAEVARLQADARALKQARERQAKEQLALSRVTEATPFARKYRDASRAAQQIRAEIEQTRRDLHRVYPIKDKASEPPELEDRLADLEDCLVKAKQDAAAAFSAAAGLLHGASSLAPTNAAVRSQLAELYVCALLDAEARGNVREVAFYQRLASQYDDGRFAELLKGDGKLTIRTSPEGANVMLCKYVQGGRRLVSQREGPLGITPIPPHRIAMGSYLLVIEKHGFRQVKCPVLITRQAEETIDIPLYTDEDIGEGMVYVPPGKCILGGDPEGQRPLPAETKFLPGFFVGQTEVACGQYLEFLNALARADPNQAKQRVPCWSQNGLRRSFWARGSDGLYEIPPDLSPDMPVFGIAWEDAEAFCRWLSKKRGRPFRLPTSAEWEKAARGADGRYFPWGNRSAREYANTLYMGKHPQDRKPVACATHPLDVSPYGVCDMAGNVAEVCQDWLTEGRKALKGHSWDCMHERARLATRRPCDPKTPHLSVGFRLAADAPKR